MSMEIQISLQDNFFISFEYIPRSSIAGSCRSSIFNFLRSFLLLSRVTVLIVCIPIVCVPEFPFLYILANIISHLFFFIPAIQTGIRLYLIVVLTCVSGMIPDVEHPFMYL